MDRDQIVAELTDVNAQLAAFNAEIDGDPATFHDLEMRDYLIDRKVKLEQTLRDIDAGLNPPDPDEDQLIELPPHF